MKFLMPITLAALALCSLQGCKQETPSNSNPKNPAPEISILGNNSALTESLNGTWQFSLKRLLSEDGDDVLGYLTLDDGNYQYTSLNKSPYRYAFIMQSKGSYELQYLPGISESTNLNELPSDTTIVNINFEIFTNPDDLVIKEFQIRYVKETSTLEFQTLLTGFQLWRLEKSI